MPFGFAKLQHKAGVVGGGCGPTGSGREHKWRGPGAGNVTVVQEDILCFTYVAVIVLQQHHRLHHVPEHHHSHAEHG